MQACTLAFTFLVFQTVISISAETCDLGYEMCPGRAQECQDVIRSSSRDVCRVGKANLSF